MFRPALMAAVAFAAVAVGCTSHGGALQPGGPDRIEATSSTSTATAAPSRAPTAAPTPVLDWRITGPADQGIAGYADVTSASPGQPVRLYVSTTAGSFRVQALRMGWYGNTEAEQVWASAPQPGVRQPGPRLLSGATNTWTAPWRASLTVDTASWPPGDYLLRLDAGHDHRAFVPLTVRAPSARGRIVLISPVTTWQAYNLWGCCDLYQGQDQGFDSRSRAVSFDRPYAAQHGAGEFLTRELPVVTEAERLGLPLAYATDVDLAADPTALDGASAVVSMGHDEYWSPQMRATVTNARARGTNLAFLGANAIFRRIRFAATAVGLNRLEINYKVASEDPLFGKDDAAVTANWPADPNPLPESSLTGAAYGCFPGRTRVPAVVADPHSWLFRGVRVRAGEELPGLIGPETDAVQLQYPTPRPIEVLLHSPTACPDNAPTHADASYYVGPSGAAVFDAGTIDWVCDLGGGCNAAGPTAEVVRTVTDNLLTAFAAPRAGFVHPAQDNLARLYVPGA
jgi:hypothetical protein